MKTFYSLVFCFSAILASFGANGDKDELQKRREYVETLPPGVVTRPPPLPVREIGCFQDRFGDRALPRLIANYRHDRNFDWFDLSTVVQKCAHAAESHGYKWFGVQFYGECWSGPNASTTYKKHGSSGNCYHGVGKHWTNMVYQIQPKMVIE